jgi:hypothetical protein
LQKLWPVAILADLREAGFETPEREDEPLHALTAILLLLGQRLV